MAANSQSRLQSQAKGIFAYGQRQVDRVVSPHSRQKAYEATQAFASERPILFAFLVAQVLFSFLPVLLFTSFALCTTAFAIISAIVFSLFWIGVATLVLVPALFVTFSIAVLVWLWAVATFLIGRYIYNMMPVHARGEMAVKVPNGKQVIFQKDMRDDGVNVKSEVASETAEIKD